MDQRVDALEDVGERLSALEGRVDGSAKELNAMVEGMFSQKLKNYTRDTTLARVKPPKYDGTSTFGAFRRQFAAAAVHNQWSAEEEAAQLIASLQGPAAEILNTIPASAESGDIWEALENRFGNRRLASAYLNQLKWRVQLPGEMLQGFALAIEQLANKALAGDHSPSQVSRDAAYSFVNGVRDRDVRRCLVANDYNTIQEALAAAMKMEASEVTTAFTSKARSLHYDGNRGSTQGRRRMFPSGVC